MKISKALKRLKRLKNKASNLTEKIIKNNRYISINTPDFDEKELIEEYLDITNEIIDLKVRIMKANIESGNYDKILRVSELRGYKILLESINTEKGAERVYGSGEPIRYDVQLGAKHIEGMIEIAEEDIESILDDLDVFNAKADI